MNNHSSQPGLAENRKETPQSEDYEELYTENEHTRERSEESRVGDAESACETSRPRRERYTGPRAPRPMYTQEQEDAIRFHRDDLCMTWNQVEEAYNGLYYEDGTPWERRTISGLQSRYYRLLPIPVNESKKQAKPRPELGILITDPERRYWWMDCEEMTPEQRSKNSTYDEQNEYCGPADDDVDEEEYEGNESEDKIRCLSGINAIMRKRKHGTLGPTSAPSCLTARGPTGGRKRRCLKLSTPNKKADQMDNFTTQVTTQTTKSDSCERQQDGGNETADGEFKNKDFAATANTVGGTTAGTMDRAQRKSQGTRLRVGAHAGYTGNNKDNQVQSITGRNNESQQGTKDEPGIPSSSHY